MKTKWSVIQIVQQFYKKVDEICINVYTNNFIKKIRAKYSQLGYKIIKNTHDP